MGILNKIKQAISDISSSPKEEEIPEQPKDEMEEIPDKFREVDLEGYSPDLMEIFEAETGKNAVWGGSLTKQFKRWADAR